MRISIDNSSGSTFDVHVCDSSKELVKAISEMANSYMFTNSVSVGNTIGSAIPPLVATIDQSDSVVIKGLIKLITAYYSTDKNKINCIKLLRTVTRWSLKDSEDLVDFAIGDNPSAKYPLWLTNDGRKFRDE